jgi:glycosyltransferase involved in cell wall biosynthesis
LCTKLDGARYICTIMETISVIITTYNSEKTIERALNSVFNQKGIDELFKLQVIAVDDCSTDDTVSIVQSFPVEFYSTQKNSRGPNKGRNIGLCHALGEAICIMDHDDEWLPNRLAAQFEGLVFAPIVTCGYIEKNAALNKETLHVNIATEGILKHYPRNVSFFTTLRKQKKGQKMYFGSIMFSNIFIQNRFEETFGKIDYDWILGLLHQQVTVEICEPLYIRYVEGKNLSLNATYRIQDFHYSLLTLEKYQKQYPEAFKYAYRRIHGSRARYHYVMGEMDLARFFFIRGEKSLKTILYYLTTFWGSKWVIQKFKVF